MKSQHIAFLVVGVALAGGLAVTMTQAPSIPVAAPAPQPEPLRVVRPVVGTQEVKPSPIPAARPQIAPAQRATAPQPVYDEPAKPAIRKSKPILMAKTTNTKPTQWTPGPYEAPAGIAKPASPVTPPPVEQAVATPAPAPTAPASVPARRRVTLQSGMAIPIRLDETLSSDRTVTGETFQASLAEPFIVDGLVIAERGARVTGRIVNSEKARVELGLATLATSDGQRVALSTDPWTKLIGSGDALSAGTIIHFRLASRVTITEQQIAGK
jgi:hypothetical protein